MSVTQILISILLAFLAGSYGWGMRGSALGGEKGAMLPGALLGIALAWCSGISETQQNYLYFAAAGAIGMYFGGTETYGQTIGFVINERPSATYKKGLVGLMLKGACWFGIFAAVFGIAFSAKLRLVNYSSNELNFAVAALIPARIIGVLVFNMPYNPQKGKFPKINFSVDRHEEWGGLLLMLLELVIFTAVKGDSFALWLILAGIFGGAVGWAIAINLYLAGHKPNKNGRLLFPYLNKKKVFDGWKLMEMTLGGFAGVSIVLCFVLQIRTIEFSAAEFAIGNMTSKTLVPSAMSSITAGIVLMVLWFVSAVQYSCVSLLGKAGKKYTKVMDVLDRVVYAYLPLMMVLCGNPIAVYFSAVVSLCWVLAEQQVVENYVGIKGRAVLGVLFFGGALATAVLYLFFDISASLKALWLIYLVSYELSELIRFFRPAIVDEHKKEFKRKSKAEYLCSYGGLMTVHPAFIAEIIALSVYGIVNF